MKSSPNFVKTTLAGGIMFLIPLVLIVIIVGKAIDILSVLVAPFTKWLPEEIIFGLNGQYLFAILLAIVICFVTGLVFRLSFAQKGIHTVEERFLKYIPGYTLLKSFAADLLHTDTEGFLKPVIIKDEDSYNLGFLVDESEDGLCTVFVPEVPRCDSGDIKILKADQIQKLNVPNNKWIGTLRTYGKGAGALINR